MVPQRLVFNVGTISQKDGRAKAVVSADTMFNGGYLFNRAALEISSETVVSLLDRAVFVQ